MEDLREDLLEAWLAVSLGIINRRLTAKLSYNEALVCHILYGNRKSGGERELTSTDLCRETRMLKSLMNSTLNALETRGMIERIRSTTDRRRVYVRLKEESLDAYREEHEHVLRIVGRVIERLGEEDARAAVPMMHRIAECVEDIMEQVGKTENEEA